MTLEPKDKKATPEQLVQPARKAPRVTQAPQVLMARTEPTEKTASMVKMANPARMAQTDIREKTERMAIPLFVARTTGRMQTRLKWCPMSLRRCLSTMVRW